MSLPKLHPMSLERSDTFTNTFIDTSTDTSIEAAIKEALREVGHVRTRPKVRYTMAHVNTNTRFTRQSARESMVGVDEVLEDTRALRSKPPPKPRRARITPAGRDGGVRKTKRARVDTASSDGSNDQDEETTGSADSNASTASSASTSSAASTASTASTVPITEEDRISSYHGCMQVRNAIKTLMEFKLPQETKSTIVEADRELVNIIKVFEPTYAGVAISLQVATRKRKNSQRDDGDDGGEGDDESPSLRELLEPEERDPTTEDVINTTYTQVKVPIGIMKSKSPYLEIAVHSVVNVISDVIVPEGQVEAVLLKTEQTVRTALFVRMTLLIVFNKYLKITSSRSLSDKYLNLLRHAGPVACVALFENRTAINDLTNVTMKQLRGWINSTMELPADQQPPVFRLGTPFKEYIYAVEEANKMRNIEDEAVKTARKNKVRECLLKLINNGLLV